MTNPAISQLRQRMTEDMTVRGFTPTLVCLRAIIWSPEPHRTPIRI